MVIDAFLGLLSHVRRAGRGWSALCPAHHDCWHPSLSVGYEAGRILLNCFVGCDVRDICAALGIRLRDLFDDDGSAASRTPNTRFKPTERISYARRLWEHTANAKASVVETYLRNRGITIPVPAAIRTLDGLTCTAYPKGMRWPAMAAGIQDVEGKFSGIAVTALCADGSAKIPIKKPRRTFGVVKGCAVRLSAELGLRLAIAEGIETALSVLQPTGIPTWAALGATNLPQVRVPDCVREVLICADVDPDSTGETAAQRLAVRLAREGKSVRIARPPSSASSMVRPFRIAARNPCG